MQKNGREIRRGAQARWPTAYERRCCAERPKEECVHRQTVQATRGNRAAEKADKEALWVACEGESSVTGGGMA